MKHILIIEDDPRISSFISKGIEANGYRTSVLESGGNLIDLIARLEPDLILLDLGLPDLDGIDLLRELRGQAISTPIIIVSARDELDDRVAGLDLGANDYIVKPFRFTELLARIRVQLRQSQANYSEWHSSDMQNIAIGPGNLRLDLKSRRVSTDGKTWTDLSGKEFIILELLLMHADRPCSRAEILDHAWNYSHDPGSNIVDVYIGYLRRKVGSDRIDTVRGIGYQLVAP